MPARIVVVDDNPCFLDHLATALKVKGHDAASFADPLDAWDALEEAQRVEVLVTRIQFAPGRSNGAALARMARMKRPQIRVLFIASPEFQRDVEELGTFLPRTASIDVILETTRRLLEGPTADPAT
jgi:DNA-binding NtrC family response regulator